MIDGQLNIFNIIGLADDPVYNKISSLKEDEELFLGKVTIRRTSKFYELESEEFHECFKKKESCYQFFSQINEEI